VDAPIENDTFGLFNFFVGSIKKDKRKSINNIVKIIYT
jgi:hypothetical protein